MVRAYISDNVLERSLSNCGAIKETLGQKSAETFIRVICPHPSIAVLREKNTFILQGAKGEEGEAGAAGIPGKQVFNVAVYRNDIQGRRSNVEWELYINVFMFILRKKAVKKSWKTSMYEYSLPPT